MLAPIHTTKHETLHRWGHLLVILLGGLGIQGCASFTNPVADGIPVRRLPDEYRGKSREELKPIPLTLLRQKPIEVYRVGPGDVLGIIIDNVLGQRNQEPPVRLPETGNKPPSMGYPIVVQDDGTIALPYIEPLVVNGKTLPEIQAEIKDAYVKKKEIIKPGTERILVSLLQRRKFHILVMREDGGTAPVPVGPTFGTIGSFVGGSKKGTGYQLDLPMGDNDVLNALASSGGLPGTDAKNEVLVHKKNQLKEDGSNVVIRIPLRLRPGEAPPFKPEDVILHDGDIVYLESREIEAYFTAGLLGTGQYPLPRDTDLDVIQAITQLKGSLLNGGFGQAQFVASVTNPGLGNPSPSLVNVLRKTATGKQLSIRIDLNRAMADPRERLLIQPGDIIVMQERPGEGLARYLTQKFSLNFLGTIIKHDDLTTTGNLVVP